MDQQSVSGIHTTLQKLLKQVMEAEKLAKAKETRSTPFQMLLGEIRHTATVGREQSHIAVGQIPYEGFFVGLLNDLDGAELVDARWSILGLEHRLTRNRKGIEMILSAYER